ncbi:calpain-1 catalytic subunit isoform X2 [Brachyhypopomus gauderio]|uniref:calpain-1 catalytic subunit isoform X2 n=1 Tax=Brachyhypopomus gauderio TaxID=698409 RepID=UPI0040426427
MKVGGAPFDKESSIYSTAAIPEAEEEVLKTEKGTPYWYISVLSDHHILEESTHFKMPPPGVCLNIMRERQEGRGVGTLQNPKKFLEQDYELLQQYYLIRGRRYIDDMFPPDNSSIGENLLTPEQMAQVEWIRPTKLLPDPHLIVDTMSRFDFAQGDVGNCWFLAALGALTFHKHIIQKVFPEGQSFQKNYAGIFHFRFWRFGKWFDVVIDDKLPTLNGKLIFVHPKTSNTSMIQRPQNEFWPALLEKAYAKVCGSYEDMQSGNVSEALMDFTGGVHMTVQLSSSLTGLCDLIGRAAKFKSLMGCGTPGKAEFNKKLPNGLVEGHAYTVTGITKVKSQGKPVELVRIFNPWGDTEWKGDWSDGSPIWGTVSAEERALYHRNINNGEFWMSVENFCQTFSELDICSLSPAFLDGSSEGQWTSMTHEGRWLSGTSAGGCLMTDTFWTNPQFRAKVTRGSSDQTQGPNILVSLMQKPDKRKRRLVRKLNIGFSIFEVPPEMKDSRGVLPASFFANRSAVAYTKDMYNKREVMEFFRLEPGEYLIVPHTYYANQTASFIMTILSKMDTQTEETMNFSMDHREMNVTNMHNSVPYSRQFSDQCTDINMEQLHKLLNKMIVKDVESTEGFSMDACQSIIALMDLSVTGTLSAGEFSNLWDQITLFKDIFFRMEKNRDAILSLKELQHAVESAGYFNIVDMNNRMNERMKTWLVCQ